MTVNEDEGKRLSDLSRDEVFHIDLTRSDNASVHSGYKSFADVKVISAVKRALDLDSKSLDDLKQDYNDHRN